MGIVLVIIGLAQMLEVKTTTQVAPHLKQAPRAQIRRSTLNRKQWRLAYPKGPSSYPSGFKGPNTNEHTCPEGMISIPNAETMDTLYLGAVDPYGI